MTPEFRFVYNAKTNEIEAYLYGDIPLATGKTFSTVISQLDTMGITSDPPYGTPATPAEFDANSERIAQAIAGGTD